MSEMYSASSISSPQTNSLGHFHSNNDTMFKLFSIFKESFKMLFRSNVYAISDKHKNISMLVNNSTKETDHRGRIAWNEQQLHFSYSYSLLSPLFHAYLWFLEKEMTCEAAFQSPTFHNTLS